MEDKKDNTEEENLITNILNNQNDLKTNEENSDVEKGKENSIFSDLINNSTERLRDNTGEEKKKDSNKEETIPVSNEAHKEDNDKIFSDENKIDTENNKQNKKEKKKWSKKKKITVIASIILGIFLILGIVFGTYIYKANGNIAEAVINAATDILGNDEPIFVLVLGVSEDINVELTDTIILAGYNPKTQKAFMLSIPRDTFIGKSEASANGYDKINALYQKDVGKTVEAVEKLTGVTIDNYIIVKNTALPAIVNAIGEVEFDVPIDMDYDDPTQDLHIHLEAGMQKIDGDKAEQLLRFRHNNDGSSYPMSYGDNDYGRMRTQREFLKVVASQLASSGNASNLKAIATAVFDNLVTDMSLGKAIGYIPYGLKFDANTIIMEQLPGSSALINELWFYKASSSQTKELVGELIAELGLTDKEIESHYKYTVKKSDTSTKKKNNTVEDESSNIKKATNKTSSNVTNSKKEEPKPETPKDNTEQNNKQDSNNNNNNKGPNKPPQNNEHTHKYSSSITSQPTCTSAGVRTYKCTGCSISYTESIPVKGHSYANGKCTVCGTVDPSYKEPENPTNPDNTGGSGSEGGNGSDKDPDTTPTTPPEGSTGSGEQTQ